MTEHSKRQTIQGTVVKLCSDKTIRVTTKVTKVHPLYQKRYSQHRSYIAHDPENSATVGQQVTLVACRPISKSKHWLVQK